MVLSVEKELTIKQQQEQRQLSRLAIGTPIDRYRIVRVLGGGGFSIVYLAADRNTDDLVVLKEYFPLKLANRDEDHSIQPMDEKSRRLFDQGRKLFFQEASLLAAFNHPSIVDVRAFFRHNGTIYIVMGYYPGVSLQSLIKKRSGRLSEKTIRNVFFPVLQGLKLLHEHQLLHLDIKPGNVYLRRDGAPMLLDFGAARKLEVSIGTKFFPVVSHGFSPIEQNVRHGKLGPWSDLYAVAATMRTCIEAKAPISAKKRMKEDSLMSAVTMHQGKYSPQLLRAIDWAMAIQPEQRPQHVDEFISALAMSVKAA